MSKSTPKKPVAKGEPMDPTIRENKNPVAATNTKRACYAIKQLVSEVEELFPETTSEVTNYDGRNTGLDVTFDVRESVGLAELLSLTVQDQRVSDVIEDDGYVLVAMRPNPRQQDSRTPFGLAAAWEIIGEGFDGEPEGSL